ncbi:MAG: hypothetical protein IH983_09970 [Planctomycetes bacterium]|nr:hypothetical protein [Planctomycetota bacterium]
MDYPIRLPRKLIAEGWRYFSPRERAILPALLLHLPNVRPGRARIGQLAGLCRSAVSVGIRELESVGLIRRRRQRRKPGGGDFDTNEYELADLSDPRVLGGVLSNLRQRGKPKANRHNRRDTRVRKRGHGYAANAVAGRSQTRSQSHHQEKTYQLKSSQGAGASEHAGSGRKRTSRSIGRKDSSRLDDDDGNRMEAELVLKLPDSAGPDRVKAVLREYGVDPGRAHNLAFGPFTTPAMVRDVLARADRYNKENPGAYIGSLMDDAIAKAKEAEREREVQAVEAERQRLLDAESAIDTMPDAELSALINGLSALRGLTPQAVRQDRAFRREIAGRLASRITHQNGNKQQRRPADVAEGVGSTVGLAANSVLQRPLRSELKGAGER